MRDFAVSAGKTRLTNGLYDSRLARIPGAGDPISSRHRRNTEREHNTVFPVRPGIVALNPPESIVRLP